MHLTINNIENIVLIGGSRLLGELSLEMKKKKINFYSFTSERQLNDPIEVDGTSLYEYFHKHNLTLNVSHDINSDPLFLEVTTENTLVLGLGQSWVLTKKTLNRLENRVFDFMGIDLPRFKGGAHYSWQILMGDKKGACHIELIDEFTVQGKTDTGIVLMSEKYIFPEDARIPIDYFDYAVKKEKDFIIKFFQNVVNGKTFEKIRLNENLSTYFPRLYTPVNGFIDWNNKISDIEKLICAFDSPYIGSSTYLKNQKVHIKSAYKEGEDINFHPFQRGLVFRKSKNSIYVSCIGGVLRIDQVISNNVNIINQIELGERFYTPLETLDKSLIIENEI